MSDGRLRLHPDVCAFISEGFYANRLQAHASTHGQGVAAGPLVSGTGLRVVSVPHRANAARSREEAERVADLVAALVGRDWTNQKGETRPLGPDDIVIVEPYNAQVAEDAPRNLEFLYSGHRLNVAISRARALAILVCSPELLRLRCQTPEQMRLANAFCRFVELASTG